MTELDIKWCLETMLDVIKHIQRGNLYAPSIQRCETKIAKIEEFLKTVKEGE